MSAEISFVAQKSASVGREFPQCAMLCTARVKAAYKHLSATVNPRVGNALLGVCRGLHRQLKHGAACHSHRCVNN